MGIVSAYRLSESFQDDHMLSVIFDSDSFFYSISDREHNLYTAVKYKIDKDAIMEVMNIITEEGLDQLKFSSRKFFNSNPHFTFVPSSEYDYDTEEIFAENAFRSEFVFRGVDIIPAQEIHVIHEYDEKIQMALSVLDGNLSVKHISSAWINWFKTDGLYSYIGTDSFSILLINKGKFVFYNQFPFTTVEDILYFIMLVLQEFNLNQDEIVVSVDGVQGLRTLLIEKISQYIRNVTSVNRGFNNIASSSEILDLFAVTLCE